MSRPHSSESSLKNDIVSLAKGGAKGSPSDFHKWIICYGSSNATLEQVEAALRELVSEGKLVSKEMHSLSDFRIRETSEFDRSFTYKVLSDNNYSSIQLVRSRVESFLNYYHVPETEKIDIIIALTEGMENAVKYSDHYEIEVSYRIEDLPAGSQNSKNRRFFLEIRNHSASSSPHADILSGKYSDGSVTLMKGLKVMDQLFDELDLNLDSSTGMVVLRAIKYLE